jgi:hypothetical protein
MQTRAQRARQLIAPSNVTPAWLLTYWRLYKGEANGDHATAIRMLRSRLPVGARPPAIDEVIVVLLDHRLI